MNSANETTLDTYEKAAEKYVQGTVSVPSIWLTNWIDSILSNLSTDAKILEIGSASGRDARYIESFGYKVEKTDAAKSFVSILRKEDPTAHYLNAIKSKILNSYDLIYANAVLLHFTREETEVVCKKLKNSLNDKGILAITLKQGEKDEWTSKKVDSPRYFCYWIKDDITALLHRIGFTEVKVIVDKNDSINGNTWLLITARK